MSLAEKRARADQLRGELSQIRVETEATLHGASAVAAEAQIDAELERLEAERQQALLNLEVAKNGGSVEDAIKAMETAAAAEELPLGVGADLATPEDTVPADAVEQGESAVASDVPIPVTEESILTPAIVTDDTQDGGK
jgi:hypothetical protein